MTRRGLGKPTYPNPAEPCLEFNLTEWTEKLSQHAQLALSDYNKKHGTDLVLSKLLDFETHCEFGNTVDFRRMQPEWIHINLEAKRQNADASEKSLLHLFSEQHIIYKEQPVLTRLLLLPPKDNLHGCSPRKCAIRLPFHQFRVGFDDDCPMKEKDTIQTRSMTSEGISKRTTYQGRLSKRQKQENSEFAKIALTDYNSKHGTKLEFVRAYGCHDFLCTGLAMDFTEKETNWMHLNFEARRPDGDDCFEELLLFAELYLGDDNNKHVLATLSVVDPDYDDATVCIHCPASILHPRFKCFN